MPISPGDPGHLRGTFYSPRDNLMTDPTWTQVACLALFLLFFWAMAKTL